MNVKKVLYLTDTHFGAPEGAWGQQPTHPHLVPQLLTDLSEWIKVNPADLVLHGGDCIDAGTVEQQRAFCKIAQAFSVPFKVCLGNHDLRTPESLLHWLKDYPALFGEQVTATGDYVVDFGPAALVVVTNCWGPETRHYWPEDGLQWAGLSHDQYRWLNHQMKRLGGKSVILALHETLFPLPPRLTGQDLPIHDPPGPHVKKIRAFIEAHRRIRLVLSGHCHATCKTYDNRCVHLTTAAYFEPPFQVRIITVGEATIDVTVAHPVDVNRYPVRIDEKKLWSAGRWQDWTVSVPLHPEKISP